jgi:uncharacterized SAM-binding protein YcdF (DUF218 family)
MGVLKAIGPPGSLGFLLAFIAASLFVGYVWPRRARWARYGVAAILGGYLVMAWPPVARALVNGLPAASIASADTIEQPDVVIVFDGDNRAGRARLAAAIRGESAGVRLLALGSTLILRELPPNLRQVVSHEPAANTREQISRVRRFAAENPAAHPVVIVSKLQAPRAARLAAAANLHAPILAAPLDSDVPASGWWVFLPSLAALAASRDAIYEHAALRYYALRGWI